MMIKTIKRRGVLRAAAAVGAGLASPTLVRAQDALESLKIIVGFPPGGSADIVSRHLGEKLVPAMRAASSSTTARVPPAASPSKCSKTQPPTAAPWC